MSFLSEFKAFALKGSVIDLAIGIIIGAAFGKIVDSFVNDLVMPVVGRFTGGLDFKDLFFALGSIPPGIPQTLESVKKAGVPVIAWGSFATVALNFVILAFVIFLMVRQVNRWRSLQAPPPPAPPPAEELVVLREIRDSLKSR